MKNTKRCSKCDSKSIIRIPGNISSFGSGNNIIWGNIKRDGVDVSRYLCSECGFLEEWIDDLADIKKIVKKYK